MHKNNPTKVFYNEKRQFITNKMLDILLSECVRTEAVVRSCSVEKVFLEISQNSQENTCARICFLIKLQAKHFQTNDQNALFS